MYVDSLVHDQDMLHLLLKKFGPAHIMLGSDYPFPLGEIDRPGKLIEQLGEGGEGLGPADLQACLLWKNAVGFLKLNLN